MRSIFVPVVAFVLVGLCWMVTSPPGVGVDEPSHYIRIVGMANGQFFGRSVPADRPLSGLTGAQLERVNAESGAFDLPGNQREPLPCNVFEPTMPFACAQYPVVAGTAEHVSFHAKYLPGAYVLPAVLARFGSSMWRTVLLARIGFLIQNTVLFAVTLLALRRRRAAGRSVGFGRSAWALLALSVTPLVAFQVGTIAPSATEVLGVAAFTAALGAVAVAPRPWRWVALGCGVMACWARDLGVVGVGLAAVAWAVADPGMRRWWRERTRADVIAAAALAVAALGAVVWQLTMKVALRPRPGPLAELWRDLGVVPSLLHQSVGLLGWLNYRLDPFVDAVWSTAWVALLFVVLSQLDRRTRWVFAGLGFVYVALNLVLIDGLRATGFGVQPRFTLSVVAVAVVLLAARASRGTGAPAAAGAVAEGVEIETASDRSRDAAGGSRWFASSVAVVVAAGHVSALVISAHRHANGLGTGAISFDQPAWSPPGGWNAAMVLFALAAALIVVPIVVPAAASAISETRADARSRSSAGSPRTDP